jgi:hypothetical protein
MPQQITLELSGISLILDRFSSYTPRQTIDDQRASFSTSPFGASVIESVAFEPKNVFRFSVLTTDSDVVTGLKKLGLEQKALIDAGTFNGLVCTDEMNRFIEKADAATRQKAAEAEVDEDDGYISYWAKFNVGMDLSLGDPNGKADVLNVILIELDKLIPSS